MKKYLKLLLCLSALFLLSSCDCEELDRQGVDSSQLAECGGTPTTTTTTQPSGFIDRNTLPIHSLYVEFEIVCEDDEYQCKTNRQNSIRSLLDDVLNEKLSGDCPVDHMQECHNYNNSLITITHYSALIETAWEDGPSLDQTLNYSQARRIATGFRYLHPDFYAETAKICWDLENCETYY